MSLRFIFTAAAFLIFFSAFSYAVYSVLSARFNRRQLRIDKRLELISAENRPSEQVLSSDFLSLTPALNDWLKKYHFFVWSHESIKKLKWNIRLDAFLVLTIALSISTLILLLWMGVSGLLSLSFGGIVALCPFIFMRYELSKRQIQLETQLPEILDFIARAMQAGHTFVSSLQMAANESREPIASEFKKTFQEISFGRSVQDSMSDLSTRIDCPEMRYFAVAVFVNQEIGGNLASLINGVATLIRERLQAKLTLHALTSEARASAWILSILPFAVALLMILVRPDFIGVLWSEQLGRSMVGYTLVLMFIGIFWMQRMAKIRV